MSITKTAQEAKDMATVAGRNFIVLVGSGAFLLNGGYTLWRIVPKQNGYQAATLAIAAAIVTACGLLVFGRFLVKKGE